MTGEVVSIQLGGNGGASIVNASDLPIVSRYKWHLRDKLRGDAIAQWKRNGVIERVFMHRLICGCAAGDGTVVFHINGNKLDNRRENLLVMAADEARRLAKGAVFSSHGHTRHGKPSPTYRTWLSMKMRCEKPYNASFRYYGAKGIAVCERWQKFDNFLADMGERPEGADLDRLNSAGNYEPSNCRWLDKHANRSKQANRKNIAHNGQIKTAREWGDIYGVDPKTILQRIRAGWAIERAVTTAGRRP